MKVLLFMFVGKIFLLGAVNKMEAPIKLRFEGIEREGGTIRLALYRNNADFMQEEKLSFIVFRYQKQEYWSVGPKICQ